MILLLLAMLTNAHANSAGGAINGQPFQYVAGKAVIRGDQVQISLWTQNYPNVCQEYFGSTFGIRMVFPAKVGDFAIDPNDYNNIIVMGDGRVPGDASNNIIANQGGLKITKITENEVYGTFVADASWMRSHVEGDFVVPRCK